MPGIEDLSQFELKVECSRQFDEKMRCAANQSHICIAYITFR